MCLQNGHLPLRLSRSGFGWELEVHSLVAVDAGVYRPKRLRIQGASAVLRYLREGDPSGVLARTTACLLRRFPHLRGEFACVNGEWLLTTARERTLRVVPNVATL